MSHLRILELFHGACRRLRLGSIKSRIIVSMALSTVVAGGLIGGISAWRSEAFMRDQVARNMELATHNEASDINEALQRVESATQTLSAYLAATMPGPGGAIVGYQDQAAPVLYHAVRQLPGAMSVYFYPNIALYKGIYGAWYVDENHGKNPARFERNRDMGVMSDFVASDPAMAYYFAPLEKGAGLWSAPYEDKDLKLQMVTYSAPIRRNGRSMGIVGMDISFDNLIAMVRRIRLYETGYGMLVSGDGAILASRQYAMGEKLAAASKGAYRDLAALIQRQDAGLSEITINGQAQMTAFTRLPSGYVLITQAPKAEAFAQMYALLYLIAGLTLGCLILSVILAVGVGIKLAAPTQRMIDYIQRLAGYDLTLEIPQDASQSEIGELNRSVRQFSGQLRRAMSEIQRNAASLSGAAQRLLQSSDSLVENADGVSRLSDETSQSTRILTDSLQSIASSARDSSDHIRQVMESSEAIRGNAQQMDGAVQTITQTLQSVALSAGDMTDVVTSVAASAQEINASLGDVSACADQGMAIVREARQDAQTTETIVSELSGAVASIDEVIGMIGDIARKTHLLALNASIEASRAGDSGRGFAVVANEVKLLAGQSESATGEIQDKIEQMREITLKAAQTLQRIVGSIDDVYQANENIASAVQRQSATAREVSGHMGKAAGIARNVSGRVSDASGAMQSIASDARNTASRIQDMATFMTSILQGAGQIRDNSQHAAAEAKKVSGGISMVTRSAGDSSQSASAVAVISNDLEQLSQQLTQMAGQFKV